MSILDLTENLTHEYLCKNGWRSIWLHPWWSEKATLCYTKRIHRDINGPLNLFANFDLSRKYVWFPGDEYVTSVDSVYELEKEINERINIHYERSRRFKYYIR